jgi:hypothetical protein
MTFARLKWASCAHSAVYATLLVVWLVPGLHTLEFVFGMAHGLGWIAMCLACLAALRRRIIGLRLAVAVAVIGAVGPFVGTYEFLREERRKRATFNAPHGSRDDDAGHHARDGRVGDRGHRPDVAEAGR